MNGTQSAHNIVRKLERRNDDVEDELHLLLQGHGIARNAKL
jgi:hypothetical protein